MADRPVLGEALGTVSALQQEGLTQGDASQRLLQVPRLAGKNQRRKGRELLLHSGERRCIRVLRYLDDRLLAPAVGRPTFGHFNLRTRKTGARKSAALVVCCT